MTKKKGLGRGLEALIGEKYDNDDIVTKLAEIPVKSINPNPFQPRSSINEKDIKPLSLSIKEKGILEPLIVRASGNEHYELIAGERRLRAAELAGLEKVPVIIRDASPVEMLEIALIENIHREDLNPIEEAESYKLLADKFERSQEDIARLCGKDRSTVANFMRLLQLPNPVKSDVRNGRLSAGHARALLSLNSQDMILEARDLVLRNQLSVRETEKLVKRLASPPKRGSKDSGDEAYFKSLSESMTRSLGAKVKIVAKGRKRIEISYSNNDELERIMRQMGVGVV